MKIIYFFVIVVLYLSLGGILFGWSENYELKKCGRVSEINIEEYATVVVLWPAMIGTQLISKDKSEPKCSE